MGIPSYFYKITNNFRNIISSSKIKHCDRLFLDFNGVIHSSYQNLKDNVDTQIGKDDFENLLLEKIVENMQFVCNYVKPKHLVYICIDGVAPLPKIHQQRKRRYLSAWLKSKCKDSGYCWDSNAISPGTPFMSKLSKHLRSYIETCKCPYELVLSDSSISGEGEHKIFNYIFHNKCEDKQYVDVIHGLDADLIMLSLICSKSKKYLLREPQHYGKLNENFAGNNPFLWLDIDSLRNQIVNYYDNVIDIFSYVLLCVFVGNDFLPQLSYLSIKNEGIDKVMSIYKSIFELYEQPLVYLDENKTFIINYEILTLLFDKLKDNEYLEMKKLHDSYYKKTMISKTANFKYEFYGVFNKNKRNSDIFKHQNWRFFYYTRVFDMNPHTDTIINDASREYVSGIEWITNYYYNKQFVNNWYYPYNYSPLILDVYNYIEVNKSSIQISHDNYDINSDIQLLMIIPKFSINVLPDHLQDIVRNNAQIGYLYPSDFEIETYLKTKLHECHPKLPYMHVNQLYINYLNTIS